MPKCKKGSSARIPLKEYWHCTIGPTTRSKLRNGADAPLRIAVESAFVKLLGEQAEMCASGWGYSIEEYEANNTVGYRLDSEHYKRIKK
jgi:hypothetical protein